MSESLLTAQQVAELLHLKPVTVYAAVSAGRIPYVRLWQGTRRSLLRFRREDIDEFIRRQSTCPVPRERAPK